LREIISWSEFRRRRRNFFFFLWSSEMVMILIGEAPEKRYWNRGKRRKVLVAQAEKFAAKRGAKFGDQCRAEE
jgi:hypothetical protein